MYNGEDIQNNHAARKLNILKGFVETEDFFEKGNLAKNNLVEKKMTDTAGNDTTRWVKPEDEENQEQQAQPQQQVDVNPNDQAAGVKTSEDHAKETESEDLKTYIANNPDGEHVAAAQAELQARGEGVDTNQDTDSDNDGQPGEMGDQQDGAIDFANPESVSQAILANKDAIVALMAEDPTLTAAHALKMHVNASGNNSEAHGALDAAQAALDAAKSATGHPGAGAENSEQPTEGLDGAKAWLDNYIDAAEGDVQEQDILDNVPEELKEFIQQAMNEYSAEDSEDTQEQTEGDDTEGSGKTENINQAEKELQQDGGSDSDDEDKEKSDNGFAQDSEEDEEKKKSSKNNL